MSNWKPVEYGRAIGRNSSEIRINRDGVVSANGLLFDFPDSLRLCERVPDEPITAVALEREGWERSRWKNGSAYAVDIVDGLIFVDTWTNLITNEDCLLVNVQIEDSTRQCPNVRTLSDLRTLVRLLGGDA